MCLTFFLLSRYRNSTEASRLYRGAFVLPPRMGVLYGGLFSVDNGKHGGPTRDMFKACSRCGKIHKQGTRCNINRVYQGGKERELRSTYRWTKKSKQIRDEAQHLCEVCKAQGRYTYNNLEVHHIVKIKDNQGLLLDDNNLIVLCVYHHKLADKGDIPIEYLQKLATDRESKVPPGLPTEN